MSDMKINAKSQISKPLSEIVQTDGDQNVAGVKTFTATDVHSNGISVTGETSKLTLQGTQDNPTPHANVKITMGKNRSSVTAGAGGDLSLLVWENDASGVYDAGLGYTGANSGAVNGLTIKNGLGNINHFCGTKNVCQMTANGMNNVVLTPQANGDVPVTATTEKGIKAYTNSSANSGFEFRISATNLVHVVCNSTMLNIRYTADNGSTWSTWKGVLDGNNSGWL
jgi:hypothetical protein